MPPYKERLYAVLRFIKDTEDNYIRQMVMGHQRHRKDCAWHRIPRDCGNHLATGGLKLSRLPIW